MKSAYELAMERLDAESGGKSQVLTAEQKEALAEIDRKFAAKAAEREIFLKGQVQRARQSGDHEAMEQLTRQLRDEKQRIDDEKEAAKDAIRGR